MSKTKEARESHRSFGLAEGLSGRGPHIESMGLQDQDVKFRGYSPPKADRI